ncbi:MAG TPA: META domain-containing protein [Xanthomonadaceae bacterium]|nr:META domain-containing protein [Xanthomonadaceae bacterium]
MTRSTAMVSATLASLALLLACAPGAPEPEPYAPEPPPERAAVPTHLIGVRWLLVDGLGGLEDQVEISLSFEADRIQGNGGCNAYSADYAFDRGALEVGPIAATKRGCPDPVGAAEQQYFQALGGARSVQAQDGTLRIETGAGVLVYQPRS